MAAVGFGSDNHSGVHPEILRALGECNEGHLPSYGTDPYTEQTRQEFKKHFGPDAEPFFAFNGTAANILSLQAITKPFESVITSQTSHLNVDECGAFERILGSKLILLPSENGKITVKQIEDCLIRGGDQHFSQPRVVSITQPTELGTLYSPEEFSAIVEFCKSKNLYLHVDGARLIHAASRQGRSLGEVVRGADVVSFGGTKNGMMMGEAVVFLNNKFTRDFKFIRKQLMQLPSKSRFIAAQFLALFKDDLYLKISRHCTSMADELARQLREISQVKITQAVESNGVFALLPRHVIAPLREKYFFYVWNEHTFELRLMTTFDTRQEHIDGFVQTLKSLL